MPPLRVPKPPPARPAPEPGSAMEPDGLAARGPASAPAGPLATVRPARPDAGGPAPARRDQPSDGSGVLTHESDEVLAARAAGGNGQAFEVLVDRYQRVIFNLTLRMTGNWDDARELTQDVFVRTWRGLRGFDPKLRFFSWIYRIAIHASLNLRRRSGRQEALEWEVESNEAGPELQVEALEVETKIHEALDRLPPGDRELLVLRHFLDHRYEEIAEVLRVPAQKVKSRLFAARKRLRVELEQRGLRP
jgi:RNA polymerase sigma-70 factor (ECF subfamily)